MTCTSLDLTLQEVMKDAVIGAAMRADRVDPLQFEVLLRGTARELDALRPTPSPGEAPAHRCRDAAQGCAEPW